MTGTLTNGVRERNLTITLGDTTSTAQLTFPATGEGPWPTVILLTSAEPFTNSAGYDATAGETVTRNLRFIAEALGAAGIAVLQPDTQGSTSGEAAGTAQSGRPLETN